VGVLRPTPATGARAGARHVETRSVTRQLDIQSLLGQLDGLATRPGVTVIVPIHDAYDDVRRCLSSLERNTNARDTEILLIDDASVDPRIGALLEDWGRRSGVRTLRNDTNQGYTRTVNRAIAACAGDVVLLNSDCEATPRWLEHLAASAYRSPEIATVTAISDNAGAFSVPRIGVANDRPHHLSGDEVARLVTRASQHITPTTPTGNGFCMYVKRAALDDVGLFDAEAFPRGYGEEGDFCMRARDAGWINVVDDSTIVFHRRTASFGAEKDELMRVGRQRLDNRHPDYTRLIREFVKSEGLVQVQETVGAAYARSPSLSQRPRPRVLYVHHRGTGGTPETTADLMGALVGGYEPYLLTSDTKALELWRTEPDGTELVERWALPERVRPEQFTQPAYRAAVAEILTRHAIDLVHVRVLLAHTFDLPSVARALDIPVVLSFHDYFLVCPTFHLLDDANRFCGGVCTPGDGACRIPSDWVRGVPHLKHSWVKEWQEAVARMLADCDTFVTTSPTARAIYQRAYPQLTDAPFHLIEHGRDLEFEPVDVMPNLRGPVRIVIPGAFDVHKGAPFVERLVELDTPGRLELHFLGTVPEEFRHLGVMHGPYERGQFGRKVHEIRPAFVGIFSIWAETYSHTLSEAWAAGVPVLVNDLGAPKERVEAHGGGWVLDHLDPEGAYKRIIEICDDPSEYRRVRAEVSLGGVRSLREMADDYDRLYRATFVSRRAVGRPERPARSVLHVALFAVGSRTGRYPPTAHVRMLQRLGHPLVSQDVVAEPTDVQAFIDRATADADLALVLRTAVPPDLVDRFLEAIRERRIPLVVDMDDNLFDVAGRADSYDYGVHQASLERMVRAADLVTVSTALLAEAMGERAARVAVVPNMLDEFLWFGGVDAAGPAPAGPGSRRGARRLWAATARRARPPIGSTCNLVYVGTRTHAGDLALLRPVFEQLRQRHELDASLFVVGGEERGSLVRRWYQPVPMPTTESHHAYPEFVPWLRRRSPEWTIAVAPLQDASFNRHKSDLKYLEYAALGLPGIYSDLGPYRDSVRHEVTGLLTENTTEAWCAAILRLASDPDLRDRIAAGARTYVLRERCLRHDAADYLRLIRDVSSSAVTTA
jgi:GT2 family glycosyltransferase/glycosyltransferase involved in cell wall biosynthesis